MKTNRHQSALIRNALIGIVAAHLRMRVRSTCLLLLNPLALVLLVSLWAGYIFVLLAGGSPSQISFMPGELLEGVSFLYGILLLTVALTAQRGSPLRLKPADIAWGLQSQEGPRVIVLFHGVSGAFLALAGSTSASAIALSLRGENPLYGLVSGASMAIIVMLLRSVSLLSHLIGLTAPPLLRRCLLLAIAGLAIIWTAIYFSRRLGIEALSLYRGPLEVILGLFEGVLTPELGLKFYSGGLAAVSAFALVLVTLHAQQLVEPAVHEGILAEQISTVLSGAKGTQEMQSRGYKRGIVSWLRWPNSPVAALLVSHLAQTRRRVRSYVSSLASYLLIVGLFVLSRDFIPLPVGILVVVLSLSVSSPSQPLAADLEHQHLLLSGTSVSRAGFLSIGLDGILSFMVVIPAALVWGAFYFGSVSNAFVFAPVLLLYCLMSSFSGLAAHIFS